MGEETRKEIRKIGVIGTGTMGQGIIQVFVQSGFEVVFYDAFPQAADKAEKAIVGRLIRWIEREEVTAGLLQRFVSKMSKADTLERMKEVDLIVEAVFEKFEVKADVLRQLDAICPPEVIFASNTSSISITKLASATKRPDKFMGMHFMNPPTMVTLIELIKGKNTSEETFNTVLELSKKIGRKPIVVSQDSPGFIANAILMPAINEAIWLVYRKIATVEDVNKTVLLCVASGKPMPILELADLVGLDVCLDILMVMYEELKEEKYKPCPLLEEMVKAGKLGRKSGEGFFKYQK